MRGVRVPAHRSRARSAGDGVSFPASARSPQSSPDSSRRKSGERTGFFTPGVLLDESVYSIHLDNDHNAAQLVERIGWAIAEAEHAQRAELAL